jgi:phosphoribosyl 1,2-cyclic phosphate phosphodiesterase
VLNQSNKRFFKLLGTGTSQGIPVPGCACAVCISDDPRDNRLRTSALIQIVQNNGNEAITRNFVIDAGSDFRQQMLRENIKTLEAVLLTHEHADHIAGIEDLRAYQFLQKMPIPVYCTQNVATTLKQRYAYAFLPKPYPGAVKFDLQILDKNTPFNLDPLTIVPVELNHGEITTLGFRIDKLAYLTDCKSIEYIEFKKLKGVEILIIDALHHDEHPAHLTLKQALEIVELVNPKRAYFIHMSHHMGKAAEVNEILPSHIQLAYDGLSFEF